MSMVPRERIEDAHFNSDLAAWVLTRYADVLAAFRCQSLVPVGPRSEGAGGAAEEELRLRMRAECVAALPPWTLSAWETELGGMAGRVLAELAATKRAIRDPVDLGREYAGPVCYEFASLVTGIAPSLGLTLLPLAEQVSAAAAEPFDELLAAKADSASAELAKHFHIGPTPMRESGFVAISQTLRHVLTNAWLALIQEPDEWGRLHSEPALTGRAVEELLRLAGLTRVLFRMAAKPVELGGVRIQPGERVILRLKAANLDGAQFENPNALDMARRPLGHFSFGNGRHACVAAPLLRMAMTVMTRALVERFAGAVLVEQIEWRGGSGFMFPAALPVLLRQ
jgi:Cytochrome P450